MAPLFEKSQEYSSNNGSIHRSPNFASPSLDNPQIERPQAFEATISQNEVADMPCNVEKISENERFDSIQDQLTMRISLPADIDQKVGSVNRESHILPLMDTCGDLEKTAKVAEFKIGGTTRKKKLKIKKNILIGDPLSTVNLPPATPRTNEPKRMKIKNTLDKKESKEKSAEKISE